MSETTIYMPDDATMTFTSEGQLIRVKLTGSLTVTLDEQGNRKFSVVGFSDGAPEYLPHDQQRLGDEVI